MKAFCQTPEIDVEHLSLIEKHLQKVDANCLDFAGEDYEYVHVIMATVSQNNNDLAIEVIYDEEKKCLGKKRTLPRTETMIVKDKKVNALYFQNNMLCNAQYKQGLLNFIQEKQLTHVFRLLGAFNNFFIAKDIHGAAVIFSINGNEINIRTKGDLLNNIETF